MADATDWPRYRAGVSVPEWMPQAARVARSFSAQTRGQPGSGHSVYLILLHDPGYGGRWGLYVGQSSRDPDLRFDQHKSGYKASGAVKRFGLRLLPTLVEHLNPMKAREALEIEAGLAEALRQAGIPWVEGGH